MLNKDYMLFNLKEASEEILKTIKEIENDPEDYCENDGYFIVAMGHIYHHLNHAWNGRNSPGEKPFKASDQEFKEWNEFPKEVMSLWGVGSSG